VSYSLALNNFLWKSSTPSATANRRGTAVKAGNSGIEGEGDDVRLGEEVGDGEGVGVRYGVCVGEGVGDGDGDGEGDVVGDGRNAVMSVVVLIGVIRG
jgi:hypothetical protein